MNLPPPPPNIKNNINKLNFLHHNKFTDQNYHKHAEVDEIKHIHTQAMASYEKMVLVSESDYKDMKTKQPISICESIVKKEEQGDEEYSGLFPQHELEKEFETLEKTFAENMITDAPSDVTQITMNVNEMRETLHKRKQCIREELRWRSPHAADTQDEMSIRNALSTFFNENVHLYVTLKNTTEDKMSDLAAKNYIPIDVITSSNSVPELINAHLDYSTTLMILLIPDPVIKTMTKEDIVSVFITILPLSHAAVAVALTETFEEDNRLCPADKYYTFTPTIQDSDMIRLGDDAELNDELVEKYKRDITQETEAAAVQVPLKQITMEEWMTRIERIKQLINECEMEVE